MHMGTFLTPGILLLTYLWFCTLFPLNPFQAGKFLEEQISKGPLFELQGCFTFLQLVYTCSHPLTTHYPEINPFHFTTSYTTGQIFFTFYLYSQPFLLRFQLEFTGIQDGFILM